MVAIMGDGDARPLQSHRQLATNLIIVNSAIAAALMVGPSLGGPTFTETVQKGLHWADDSRVWGMLCTTALIVNVVAAIFINQSKSNDSTEPTVTVKFNKNTVTAEVVAPSMTIVYGLVILALTVVGFVLGQLPGAAEPQSSLELSTSSVKDRDTYSATAKGFKPDEVVKFSWDGGPMDDAPPADSVGSTTLLRIVETAPPGNYTLTATGQASGRTASAKVQVVQPGN
jgi:hypothetical protein